MATKSIRDKRANSYTPMCLFAFAALVWRSSYYVASLYVAIPLLIIYCFWFYKGTILRSQYWAPYFLMILWMFLSTAVSDTSNEGFRLMVPITASLLLSFAGYSLVRNNNNYWVLYVSYIALLAYLLYQNLAAGGFVQSFDYSSEAERNSSMMLNANDYAYYTLFATMSLKLSLEFFGPRIRGIYKVVLYIAFALLSFYVALFTASRQVLALQIPLLAFFFYYDFLWRKKGKVWYLFLLILLLIAFLPYLDTIYSNSYLSVRSQVGFQEDVRSEILKRAFFQGLEYPLFGLGIGADTFFSHCTYTHLFARCGLIAAICFIVILYKGAITQLKRYRKSRDRVFFLYLVLVLFIAVGNFTYSYVQEPFMMTILFVILGNSDRYYYYNYC